MALIGFGFGGFNIFNFQETYYYCKKGDEICIYRFELYIYTLCVFYIIYRFCKYITAAGRKDIDNRDGNYKIAVTRRSADDRDNGDSA